MKKSLFLFVSGLITGLILLFVSCENFMNGSNIQEQLEEMIDVANAKSYTIIVQRQDSEVGAFLSDGDKECKVGYSIDLQFTVNSENYKYLGMEAVSKVNPTKSRSDYVEFIEMSSEPEEKSGIFKVQVKLIKESDDIMIRPKCVLLPKVTQIKPDLIPTGYDQDEIVKITFNKPIDNTEKPFENFNNISIFSDTSDLQDFFDEPYFTDGDTVLNLRPKQDIHILTPDSNQKTNVTVIIDLLEVKDTDGEALAQKINHTYRINDSFGNQKTTIIRAREDENSITGTFDKTGDIQCTVGYSKDFQFTVKKASYVFKGLTATTSDGTPIDESTVEFSQVKADEEAGIYTIRVLVKQEPAEEVEAIVIKPNCVLIPKVVEITPDYKPEGYYQDTQLVIKFNKEVNPESFFEDGAVKGLSITSDDGDMLSYYNTPEFSEDKKTLYIKPLSATDASKLILPPDQSRNNMDLKLQYNFAEAEDADGLSIEQSGLHEYKINKTFTNQKIVTVLIEADETYGRFLSAGEKECTVGYTLDFQFTIKKADYSFEGFEAVSTGATPESRADYVAFESPDFDFDNGVFKAKVRIKSEKNDIQIRPKCKLIPKVTSVSPAMSANGCAQDTEIEITFNKAVNTQDFNTLAPVYIYSADGDNLSSYFGTPHFSADSKTLIITPLSATDLTKVILPPDGTKNTQNLKVQYDFSKAKDTENLSINQAGSFDYKINKEFELQRIVSLLIPANDVHGTFLSTGQKECTVGFTTDIQFTVDKANYVFTGFDAVSSEDESASRASFVSFESVDANDEKGIYKAKVRVNNVATIPEDIKIIPKCVPVPKITGMEPENNYDGVQQDSTISLIFNKPVTSVGAMEYLKTALTITDSSGQSLAPYFGDPYFSADSTILYIPTVKTVRLLSSKTDKKDIVVKFDLSSITDELGNVGSGFYQNKYRVNGTLDSVKPILSSVTVYTAQNKKKQILATPFEDWPASSVDKTNYIANHVKGSVYAELEGYDEDSGIARARVYEKLLKYSDGSAPDTIQTLESSVEFLEQSGSKYCLVYDMKNNMDGIVELTFNLEDYAGNVNKESEAKKVYVLKDTLVDSSSICFDQEISQFEISAENWLSLIPVIEGDTQDVKLTITTDSKDTFYSDCSSDYTIDAFWGYSKDAITNPVTVDRQKGEYTFTRDVTKFVYIKLIVSDEIGNTSEIIKYMDPRPEFSNIDAQTLYSYTELTLKGLDSIKLLANKKLAGAGGKGGDRENASYTQFIFCIYDSVDAKGNPVGEPTKLMNFSTSWNEATNSEEIIPDGVDLYTWKMNATEEIFNKLIRVYGASLCGDFLSPMTTNYVEYMISSVGEYGSPVYAEGKAPRLSNAGDSSETTTKEVSYEYGPYIKDTVKVKTERVPNAGMYKVTIEDYKTAAAITEGNVQYRFLVFERWPWFASEEDAQNAVVTDENCLNGMDYTYDEPVFYLPAINYYKFYIEATGRQGSYMSIDMTGKDYDYPNMGDEPGINFYLNDATTSINFLGFSEDITPPNVMKDQRYSNPFGLNSEAGGVKIALAEDDSGLYKNKKGNYELTYYLIPATGTRLQTNKTYTLEELEKNYSRYKRTIEYTMPASANLNNPDMNMSVPMGNEKGGVYNLVVVYEDIHNNANVVTYPCVNRLIGDLTFTKSTTSWEETVENIVTTSSGYYDDFGNYFEQQEQHTETSTIQHSCEQLEFELGRNDYVKIYQAGLMGMNNRWESIWSSSQNNSNTYRAWNPYAQSSSSQGTQGAPLRDQWLKICGYKNTDSAFEMGFYNTQYYYLTDNSSITCNSKNAITGLNGIQIFFDNPILVHTLFFKDYIPDDIDRNDYSDWERRGAETGVLCAKPSIQVINQFDSSGNYCGSTEQTVPTTATYSFDENYKGIPSGCYYRTIIHFADGDVIMSDIKYME